MRLGSAVKLSLGCVLLCAALLCLGERAIEAVRVRVALAMALAVVAGLVMGWHIEGKRLQALRCRR